MKVLCECWRKSDTCIACYMANLEDWNQIHAIAMSAEAQRRLEDDLRFLESINVWHLVNLRPTPPPPPPPHDLYGYGGDALDIITPSTEHGSSAYSTNPYHNHQYHHHHHHHHPGNHPAMYGLQQENRYLPPPPPPPPASSSVTDLNHQNSQRPTQRLSSPGYGTSLPYPDLIIHTRDLSPPLQEQQYFSPKPTTENNYITPSLIVNGKQFIKEDVKKTPPIIKKHFNNNNPDHHRNNEEDHSTVIKNNALSSSSSSHDDNPRLRNNNPSNWRPSKQEPEDYDREQTPTTKSSSEEIVTAEDPDGKKSVKFTPETVFVERDMDSPFWKAFTERRRQRRIHRQRKQLNAQIASASYQPSLVEIVKSAFSRSSPSKDSNGNCTTTTSKRKQSKGEVLVYDNSSQVPETYTAQYVYSAPAATKKSSKLLQIITCQCRSVSPP